MSEQSEKNQQLIDLLLEKCQDLSDKELNKHNNSNSIAVAREHIFLENLDKSLERNFKNKIVVPKYSSKKRNKINRQVTVILSDCHFGSDLDPLEVPLEYGKIQESRRFASIVKQTLEYKTQYRNHTKLNLMIIGDLFQAKLHDAQAAAAMSEQLARTIHLLVEGIIILCNSYPEVSVWTQSGNHGRDKGRHKDRAVDAKWDSLDTVVYYAVKKALRNVSNLKFNIPKTPYIAVDIFNKRAYFSHGDTGIKVPFPGSNINVKAIKNQMNETNATMGKNGKEFSLFGFGHCHTGAIIRLNNATLLTNGCLIPPDPYALSNAMYETDCGQWLFESVQDYIIGDSRYLQVNEKTDKDASLDKIIKPFDKF